MGEAGVPGTCTGYLHLYRYRVPVPVPVPDSGTRFKDYETFYLFSLPVHNIQGLSGY